MSQIIKNNNGGGGGGSNVQTLTPNSGGAVSPVANNINDQGLAANPGGNAFPLFSYNGGAGQLNWENRTYLTPYVVDPSTTDGSKGTFTTIQGAITQAVSDGVPALIYIRPGTYTENLTFGHGISLQAFDSNTILNGPNDVTIIGSHTYSPSSASPISCNGIVFQTNSANLFTLSNDAFVDFTDCSFYIFSNIGFVATAVGQIYFFNCTSIISNNAQFFTLDTVAVIFIACLCEGASTVASTANNAGVSVFNSVFQTPITTTGTTSQFLAYNSSFGSRSGNSTTLLTHNNTNVIASSAYNCSFENSSFPILNVGAGATFYMDNGLLVSTNTNVITGSGTLNYGVLSFAGTSSHINVTTQIPFTTSNDAKTVITPGAYPYTVLPQDYLILVDTTSARSIVLESSPKAGISHIIKDNTGTAGSNNITVTPAAGNIDGSASYVMNVNFGSATFIYNGTQWNVV